MQFSAVIRSGEAPTSTSPLDDYPDVDSGSCQLLGPTALVVQGLLGILVLLSLVYKRYREKPRRPWRIWLFDVSKQVVGQMFVHGVNVLISGVISELTDRNACVFYFLNIGIDTTLGVGIIYGSLRVFNFILSERLGLKGFESGVYGDPPSLSFWTRQTATYLGALLVMKIVVIGMFVFIPGVFTLGEWMLSWTHTGNGDALQVIFVMGLFPIVMNILQFWLIDSIVKASSSEPSVSLEPDTADPYLQDRQPLFDASDDEEDDRRGPRDLENQLAPHPSRSTLVSSYETEATLDVDETFQGKDVPIKPERKHSYPPSLTGSLGSTSGGSVREAKNLLKAGRRKVSPSSPQVLHHQGTTTTTLDSQTPTAAHQNNNDDWAISWDDEGGADVWNEENKPNDVKAQEHDRNTGSAGQPSHTRARRLS
ncbi:vacuolar membrane protein [Coprinopsis cinerea AmutBmut pab1-1]|nr:vacuolar membrane protein [Coprinopsis cinerea AmutBmut pab1-1]